MIYYFVTAQNAGPMQSFLATWGKSLVGMIKIVTYESLLADGDRVPGQGGTYIFSSLGSIRRMEPHARTAIIELHRRLVDACGEQHVLNDPKHSLNRYEVLRTLYERGINQFNVHRLDEQARPERFPVFIRQEHGTQHRPLPLINDVSQYDAAVSAYKKMRGSIDGLLAVEFCDTRDGTGLYRKYGAFVIGDRIVPRHVFFGRHWMVKLASTVKTLSTLPVDRARELIEEELAFLDSNPHEGALRECVRLAHISFGRIDYGLLDGQPQIWEINATAALTTPASEDLPQREQAHRKFVARFAEALATLDS